MARRRTKTISAKEVSLIDSQFDQLGRALDSLSDKEAGIAAKQALSRIVDLVYPDMEKEFKTVHPGTGKTLEDLSVKKPHAAAGSGGRSYSTQVEYLRKRTQGKGFVALFFNLGVPHMTSASSRSSIGFIDRAMGLKGANPARMEQIRKIIQDEYEKALEKTQASMDSASRGDLR